MFLKHLHYHKKIDKYIGIDKYIKFNQLGTRFDFAAITNSITH